jgi:hypothetical protein
LSGGRAYGTIADSMKIITTGKEEKYLNTLERYHIFETLHKIYAELQCTSVHIPLPAAS